MKLSFHLSVVCFLVLVQVVSVRTKSYGQSFVSKKGGVCFRFDDYQKAADLERLRVMFNKHNVKFTYALNTGIGEIFGDTAYWNVVRRMEQDGHELAEQAPSDASHYFDTKTPADAQYFVNRPGIDHVTSGSNRVCLSYRILNGSGAGDESRVDVRRDTIISKANGEFAWSKLINVRYTSHLYLPGSNKLLSLSNVMNANPNNPDTIIVRDFWKEGVNLGTLNNVVYRRLTPFDLSILPEGMQTMMEYSQKIFIKNGLKIPTTFIHPGGAHPYVSPDVLKSTLEPLGFKGGASYPFERFGITYHNPKGLNQFVLQGGNITPEGNSLAECKQHIAEFYAKNNIVVSINHLNSLGVVFPFNQMMLNLEQLVIWCKSNNIPIKTYKEWVQVISDSYYDQTSDIFPPLQNDFDEDGKVDGLQMPNPNVIDTVNGLPYNNNVCLSIASKNSLFNFNRLYGLNRGKNTISLSTKGGKNIYDYFTMVVDMPEAKINRIFNVPTNTANYTERSFDIEVPAGVTYLDLILNYNTDNNQRVYVSGIKIRSLKKPSFRTAIIQRKAHEAFVPTSLTNFAACNGFAPSQLQFAILRAPIHLTASLVNARELHLLPKNNRFWVGVDSLQVRVSAPDNTADTAWLYIQSVATKTCNGAIVPIAINVDSVNDQSYLWSAMPVDPFLSPSNAAAAWVRPISNTRYANTITFKNTNKRRDSIMLEVLPSKTVKGAFETKHFGANNSLSYSLNYPDHLNIYLNKLPGNNATVTINNKTVTITRPAGFNGLLETELFISSATCEATIHTLASSTYPTALDEVDFNKDLVLFPNPFTHELNVRNLPNGSWQWQVFSITGALLFQSDAEIIGGIDQVMPLPALLDGIYFLKLQSKNQHFIKKIVKN